MLIKGITDEDFINYKVPSMYIATATCSFKCDKEYGKPICQNSGLVHQPSIDICEDDIVERYLRNPITKAIVFGGLEPMDQYQCILWILASLRSVDDDVVIYTGYNKNEIDYIIPLLQEYKNIIVKFGRYIPNQQPHYDPVLGVYLASDNQYAEKIS